jgi:hypothetical protein
MKYNEEYGNNKINVDLLFGIGGELVNAISKSSHFVTKISSNFLKKMIIVTKSKPCPYLAFPWYDDSGNYADPDKIEEKMCFERWKNNYNQEELIKSCGEGGLYNFSCNNWIIVNSLIGLSQLKKILGEYLNEDTTQELQQLVTKAINNIDLLEWFIIPDNADVDYILFVCSEKHRDWIDQLKS